MQREPDILLIARAADFAARQHTHQRRKGEAEEPYFNHLSHVALLLAEAGADAALVAAGFLHDTIEDQDVSFEDLVGVFGEDVATLVRHVTDDKSLPKQRRKDLQVEHAPSMPPRAQQLKLADKCANLEALLHSPPKWDAARKQAYFDWAAQVVDGCRGASPLLEARFDALYQRRAELAGPG